MSKRDDDSHPDIELGMTTAERRRRRRRGGGLRVPSDNVPRRSTTPPVVAPVPEDPALAMSIAYSFTSDASEPVARVDHAVPSFDPVAPEQMSTVIDPPSAPVESADFEMKTREMSAVDLASLGLDEAGERISSPRLTEPNGGVKLRSQTEPTPPAAQPTEVDIDMDDSVDGDLDDSPEAIDDDSDALGGRTLDSDPPDAARQGTVRMSTEPSLDPPPVHAMPPTVVPRTSHPSEPPPIRAMRAATDPGLAEPPPPPRTTSRERLRTVALSEDDLEEVREAVRAGTVPSRAQTQPVRAQTQPTQPPPVQPAPVQPAPVQPPQPSPAVKAINVTQPLTALDVEVADERPPEPMSVPEIDIHELAERADGSGEIEVDVDEAPLKAVPQATAVTPPPPMPSSTAPGERRSRPPSVPPPMSAEKGDKPAPPTPPPQAHAPHGKDAHAPPPPPAQPKSPPTPPPKSTKAAVSPSTATPRPEAKGAPRGKPWFVDLFDEDYLRTLPFLTPQATQSEAEFVIEAMGLQPGAQVIDIGCGYGRHAMELAARGYHLVGLDLSTPLLVRGGEEAMRRGLEINFIRGDMRELDFDSQFDGAYCLFSTFGYFDDETNKKTIANIARALKPGGRVMIEILNRDYIIADLPTRVWWEGDGCVVLEEVELNYFSSRIQVNRSVVFDDGRQLEQEISVRAYSLHEVGKLMHAAGFRVLEVSGGYHTRGRFFGNQSRHIIVLAERKDPAAT